MTYRVVHRTEYHYDASVSSSYGEVHLHPREAPGQQCYSAAVSVEPFPEDYRERRDFFGNRVAHFHVRAPHSTLVVTATSVVDVRDRMATLRRLGDRTWEVARDGLRVGLGAECLDARQFALDSPRVPSSDTARAFAGESFPPGRPIAEGLADLAHRIHGEFEFAPGSTSVSTSVDLVLEKRKGVCQDFAHLAIAGLRSLGLACRYVSGYLETLPPPGRPRLQGADVSHAWLSVFVPEVGWVDVDPTNDQFANDRYVTVAWGRDYGDVPPMKGVIFTEAKTRELEVTVDVVELAEDDPVLVGA